MTNEEVMNKYDEIYRLTFFSLYQKDDWIAYFELKDTELRFGYQFLTGRMYWFVKLMAPPKYEDHCGYEEFCFDEVLNRVPADIQTKLLFNLDLFK